MAGGCVKDIELKGKQKAGGKRFGGLGGSSKPMSFSDDYSYDEFAITLNACLGDYIRESPENAFEVWSALANVEWRREGDNGDVDTAAYSFRAAGDLLAAIRADGTNYNTCYCSGNDGEGTPFIAEAMKEKGWEFSIIR